MFYAIVLGFVIRTTSSVRRQSSQEELAEVISFAKLRPVNKHPHCYYYDLGRPLPLHETLIDPMCFVRPHLQIHLMSPDIQTFTANRWCPLRWRWSMWEMFPLHSFVVLLLFGPALILLPVPVRKHMITYYCNQADNGIYTWRTVHQYWQTPSAWVQLRWNVP